MIKRIFLCAMVIVSCHAYADRQKQTCMAVSNYSNILVQDNHIIVGGRVPVEVADFENDFGVFGQNLGKYNWYMFDAIVMLGCCPVLFWLFTMREYLW